MTILLPNDTLLGIDALHTLISDQVSDLIMDSSDIPVGWSNLNDPQREKCEDEFYDMRYVQIMTNLAERMISSGKGKHRA